LISHAATNVIAIADQCVVTNSYPFAVQRRDDLRLPKFEIAALSAMFEEEVFR